jgi:hypothetical protein
VRICSQDLYIRSFTSMMISPEQIELSSTSKLFEYEKMAREVDACNDIDELQLSLKSMVKLFLKQQEVTSGVLRM